MAKPLIAWSTNDLHTSAQLVLAKRLGFFREEGIQVQCKLFPSEEQFIAAFEAQQQLPFVWSQTVPQLLRLCARGLPVKIISPLAEISASCQVIIRESADIVLPGDFEGRKLAIMRGSLAEIAFRNMAKDFGVELDLIQFVHAPPLRQLELFATSEVDAIACWEPWASQACYMGGQVYFSGLYSHIPGHEGPVNWLTGQSVLVTSEAAISTEAAQLLAVLRGIRKATRYLTSTLGKAASVFSDLLGTEHDELITLLQKNIYTMKMDELFQIGLISIRNMFILEGIAGSMPEFPECNQIPEIEDLYDSTLLAHMDPALVRNKNNAPEKSAIALLAHDNLYYPADAHIHARGSEPLQYIIVDDTQVVLDMFSEIVEMLGGQVVGTASTGAEAMVLYIDHLPDVVVIDISMPDMNGIEAIKSILGINPNANIIVISGNNYEEIRQEVFRLGVKMFIGKPFHLERILEAFQILVTTEPQK